LVVYDDTSEEFKIYGITDAVWTLLGSKAAVVSDFSVIRAAVCGRQLGLAFHDGSKISYNFFDLDSLAWAFASFKDLAASSTYGDISEMTIAGGFKEDETLMFFGWVSCDSDTTYLVSMQANYLGVEVATDLSSPVIESRSITVQTSSEYIVNGYRNLAMDWANDNVSLIAIGAISNLFSISVAGSSREWSTSSVEIDGLSNGVAPTSVSILSGSIYVALADMSGDVYYFEQSSDPSSQVSDVDIVLMNEEWMYVAPYQDGALDGDNIAGVYDTYVGSVLGDSKKRLAITHSQIDNPPDVPTTTTTSTTTGIPSTPRYYATGFGDSDLDGCYWGPEPNPGLIGSEWYRHEDTDPGDRTGTWIVKLITSPNPPGIVLWIISKELGLRAEFASPTPVGDWNTAIDPPPGSVASGCP
jgi:hypothetical protein